jgi:pilus assembly protein Flp/PilA
MLGMYLRLKNQLDDAREEGQGLVEYALIIVLVSVALVLALGGLKTALSGVFSTISADL